MTNEPIIKELLTRLLNNYNIQKADQYNSIEKFINSEYFHKFVTSPNFEYCNEVSSDIINRKPSFRELKGHDILMLRYSISQNVNKLIVHDWLIALMRFCEIRYSQLKNYAMIKWNNKKEMKYNMLQLTALLMDYYYYSKDLRFLNTVLKMRDLKWLVRINKLHNQLKPIDMNLNHRIALLQFQIFLLTEYEIRKLTALKNDEKDCNIITEPL